MTVYAIALLSIHDQACLGRGHGPADHFPVMVMLEISRLR
jgi:hypothetical protein